MCFFRKMTSLIGLIIFSLLQFPISYNILVSIRLDIIVNNLSVFRLILSTIEATLMLLLINLFFILSSLVTLFIHLSILMPNIKIGIKLHFRHIDFEVSRHNIYIYTVNSVKSIRMFLNKYTFLSLKFNYYYTTDTCILFPYDF